MGVENDLFNVFLLLNVEIVIVLQEHRISFDCIDGSFNFVRNVWYEIALQYGFSYDTEEEKYFILLLIRGALADWDTLQEIEKEIDVFMETELLPMYYSREGQIRTTAAELSKEMLYMKFLQGTMVIGVIGGVYDVIYMKKINEYAELKYRRRFYNKMLHT